MPLKSSFHDNLNRQIGLLNLNDKQKKIAQQIIGSIDDDGYQKGFSNAIIDDLLFAQNVDAKANRKYSKSLKEYKTFDPLESVQEIFRSVF